MRNTKQKNHDILKTTGDDEDTTAAELRGVQRALHLDNNWIELTTHDGKHQRCETPPATLNEVAGPMVNGSVIVYGRWKRRTGYKDKFLLKEIDLDEDAAD